MIAFTGTSRKEITEHWEWLEHNLLQTLSIFENENDITTFVKGKVQVMTDCTIVTLTCIPTNGQQGATPGIAESL